MAGRIPEITRGRLASAQTGVVRADPAIGKAISGFGRAVVQAGQQQVRQQRAQQAKTQGTLDTVNASGGVARFSSELNRLGRESQNQEQYDKSVQGLFKDSVEGFETDEARSQFSKKASTLMVRKGDEFFKSNEKRKVEQIQTGLNDTVEELSRDVDDVFGDPEIPLQDKLIMFAGQVDVAVDTIESARPALGEKSHAAFREESAQTLTRAAALALLESNPEQVETFLDEVNAAGILDKEEIGEIKKDAADYMKKIARTNEAAAKLRQSSIENEFTKKVTDDGVAPSQFEIDAAVLQGEISKGYAESLKKFKKSSKAVFAQDNAATYGELEAQFSSITKTKDTRRGRKITVNKDVSFEQLSLFRQKVLESMEAGELSKETGRLWMNRISPKFDEKIGDLLESINQVDIVKDWWPDSTENILTEPAEIADANMRLQNEFMQTIDKKEVELQRRLQPLEMKDIVDDIKENFVLRTKDNRATFKLGQLRKIGGIMYRVTGFDTDGEPIIDDNLNASVKETPKK